MRFLGWQLFAHVLSHVVAESIKHIPSINSTGKGHMEAWPGFFWTLSHVPFHFVNFNLYPFTIINHNHEYNIFL